MGGGTRRYCLSPRACEGILRRAEERGKVLPKALEETLMKMVSVPNGGGYKVTGTLCAVDRKGIGNQYVDQGKVVMEPCGEKDMFMVSQESFVNVADKISLTLRARDYKAPNAVCYEEPTIYDMKQHHAPSEMNVISWKERDRLAPIMNNMAGTLAASDYKGTSFVGYMENQKVPILNFQGSKGNSIAEESNTMYTLNAMHGHDVHCIVDFQGNLFDD